MTVDWLIVDCPPTDVGSIGVLRLMTDERLSYQVPNLIEKRVRGRNTVTFRD